MKDVAVSSAVQGGGKRREPGAVMRTPCRGFSDDPVVSADRAYSAAGFVAAFVDVRFSYLTLGGAITGV